MMNGYCIQTTCKECFQQPTAFFMLTFTCKIAKQVHFSYSTPAASDQLEWLFAFCAEAFMNFLGLMLAKAAHQLAAIDRICIPWVKQSHFEDDVLVYIKHWFLLSKRMEIILNINGLLPSSNSCSPSFSIRIALKNHNHHWWLWFFCQDHELLYIRFIEMMVIMMNLKCRRETSVVKKRFENGNWHHQHST